MRKSAAPLAASAEARDVAAPPLQTCIANVLLDTSKTITSEGLPVLSLITKSRATQTRRKAG